MKVFFQSHHVDATLKSHTRYLDFLDILLTARDDDGCGLSDQEIYKMKLTHFSLKVSLSREERINLN